VAGREGASDESVSPLQPQLLRPSASCKPSWDGSHWYANLPSAGRAGVRAVTEEVMRVVVVVLRPSKTGTEGAVRALHGAGGIM
jgi:hypothetical protein